MCPIALLQVLCTNVMSYASRHLSHSRTSNGTCVGQSRCWQTQPIERWIYFYFNMHNVRRVTFITSTKCFYVHLYQMEPRYTHSLILKSHQPHNIILILSFILIERMCMCLLWKAKYCGVYIALYRVHIDEETGTGTEAVTIKIFIKRIKNTEHV